jgi:hypothetical protein
MALMDALYWSTNRARIVLLQTKKAAQNSSSKENAPPFYKTCISPETDHPNSTLLNTRRGRERVHLYQLDHDEMRGFAGFYWMKHHSGGLAEWSSKKPFRISPVASTPPVIWLI